MASRPVFERNLAALRRRHPGLAERLAEASTEDVEVEVGPRGASILTQAGVRLGSAYDPVREGEQIAASMASEPADIMVAVGIGLGEQFAPYLEANPGTLIIFEPSLARLRAALERISIVNLFGANRDFYVVSDIEAFRRIFGLRYAPGLRVRVFPHPALLRLDRLHVERNRAHGPEFVIDIERGQFTRAHPFKRSPARLGRKPFGRRHFKALLQRELLRPIARQEHMRTVGAHAISQQDRIAHGGHARHRSSAAITPVHDRGIEFVCPFPGENCTASGIEQRIVFQRKDRSLNRIHRASAFGQYRGTRIKRFLQRGLIGSAPLGRHPVRVKRACPAMDRD